MQAKILVVHYIKTSTASQVYPKWHLDIYTQIHLAPSLGPNFNFLCINKKFIFELKVYVLLFLLVLLTVEYIGNLDVRACMTNQLTCCIYT